MNREQLIEYVEKRYPEGSYYLDFHDGKSFHKRKHEVRISPSLSTVWVGDRFVFYNRKWVDNCDEFGNIIPYKETDKIVEIW